MVAIASAGVAAIMATPLTFVFYAAYMPLVYYTFSNAKAEHQKLKPHQRFEVTWENEEAQLNCGNEIIQSIEFASFGRPFVPRMVQLPFIKTKRHSNYIVNSRWGTARDPRINRECHTPLPVALRADCVGQHYCAFNITILEFNDPCYLKFKYFVAEYHCKHPKQYGGHHKLIEMNPKPRRPPVFLREEPSASTTSSRTANPSASLAGSATSPQDQTQSQPLAQYDSSTNQAVRPPPTAPRFSYDFSEDEAPNSYPTAPQPYYDHAAHQAPSGKQAQ